MNIIFDWSGTLADDRAITLKITNLTLENFGGKAVSMEEYLDQFKLPASEFYRPRCPEALMDDLEDYFIQRCLASYQDFELYPGVTHLLEGLQGRHRLFILSSIDTRVIESALRVRGLRSFFRSVVGGARDKLLALKELVDGECLVRTETLFIGDTVHDVLSAKSNRVPSGAALYGYTHPDRLKAAHPDFVFPSPKEIRKHVEKAALTEQRSFPIVTVGGLVTDSNGRFLLVRTEKWSNLFGTPGGKVEYGETLEQAFRREIHEETGLEITDIRFVMVQDCVEHPQFHQPRHFVLVNYIARLSEDNSAGEVILNYEASEFRWTTFLECEGMPLNEPTRVLVDRLKEMNAI